MQSQTALLQKPCSEAAIQKQNPYDLPLCRPIVIHEIDNNYTCERTCTSFPENKLFSYFSLEIDFVFFAVKQKSRLLPACSICL